MKNIMQNLFLFLSLCLFNWVYGQGTCNSPVTWTTNNFTATNALTVNSSQVPVLGDQFSNKNLLTDNNLTNAATWSAVAGTAYIEVQNSTTYPAGTYAGVVLSDYSAVSLSSKYTIETFLGNDPIPKDKVEVSLPIKLLSTTNRNIGLVSTKPYDKIRVTIVAVGVATYSVNYFYSITPCTVSTELVCNESTAIIQDKFPAVINYEGGNTGLSGLTVGSVTNLSNIVNSDANDFGTIELNVALGAVARVSVKDLKTTYEKGSFAGFDIENSNLLNLDLLKGIKINTYLKGVLQESSTDYNLLLKLSLIGNGRSEIGFVTIKDFDEVQYVQTNTLDVKLGTTKVYKMVIKKACEGPELVCNTNTRLTDDMYPVSIGHNTGVTGLLTLGTVSNPNRILDSDPTNYATINVLPGVLTTATLAVKKSLSPYPTNTYVSFDIENTSLINLSILSNFSIRLLRNGAQVGIAEGANLAVGVDLLSTSKKSIGYVSTVEFDEIQLTMNNGGISVDLGETRVYNVNVRQLCEGPALACNTNTLIGNSKYPVNMGSNTGVSGVATVGNIVDINHILDNDPLTYASINIAVGAFSSATIAIHKHLTPYNPGTYVSFDVEFTSLINVAVLPKFKLRLLRNGAQVGIVEGSNFLLGANVATNIRQTLGFKSPAVFDEIQLIYEQPVGISLGTVKIYDLYLMNPCQNPIDCSTNHPIENTPTHPVVINQFKTGPEDIVCALCGVDNAQNLITPSGTDYATLNMNVGVGGTVGISVLDLTNRYPSGTYVGFTIEDVPYLLQADVLEGFFVKTYLNGVLQEVANDASLLDLSLILSIGTGKKNYGFRTTKPFDEVKFEVFSLISAFNNIKVYNLKIDASNPLANDGNLNCQNNICVKPGDNSGVGIPSTIGVSTLASPRPTWPADIPNGYIVLESKNKGLVISRVSNSTSVLQPQEGMLIYDLSASCIKLYNGVSWKCISKSCNE